MSVFGNLGRFPSLKEFLKHFQCNFCKILCLILLNLTSISVGNPSPNLFHNCQLPSYLKFEKN